MVVKPAHSSITKPSVPEFTVEVDGRRVSLIIENQPFESYADDDGWTIRFYYNVRLNGQTLYRASDGYPTQSSSEYTVISYNIRENADSYLGAYLYEVGNTLNFQVEAMIGYVHRVYNPNATSMLTMYPWRFTGEKSGWSETQTLTISAPASTTTPNTSPSQNSTASPDQSGSQNVASSSLDWVQFVTLTLLSVIIVLLVIVIVYLYRSTKRT